MKLRLAIFGFVAGLAASAAPAETISPGTIDFRFDAGTPIITESQIASGGYENTTRSILVLPDDSFLVTGGGTNRVLKFERNGRADKLFGLRFPEAIQTAITNRSGQVLALARTDTSEQRLVQLNLDGTTDETFQEQTFDLQSFWPICLAVQVDGQILAAGSSLSGEIVRRFKATGEPDNLFKVTGSFLDGIGLANLISVQSNGQIIVAGRFVMAQGTLRNRLARLNADGTLDVSYNPGLTMFSSGDLQFFDMVLDSNDNLYLTGNFTVVEDQVRQGVVRLTSSGAMDRTFVPDLGISPIGSTWPVNDLSLSRANNVFLAGEFRSFRITNSVVDESFGGTMGLDSLREASDGSLYVYARFMDNVEVVPRVCRLSPDGIWDRSFNPPGPNGTIRKVRALSSGDILIGGDFGPKEPFYTFPRAGLAILHSDGTLNTNFNVPFDKVLDFDVDTNGHAFVVAQDSSAISQPYLARVNLEGPPELITFQPQDSSDSYYRSVLVLHSGKVLVSGINESSRFNPDLTPDPAWKAVLPGGRMVEAPDGSIYGLDGSTVYHVTAEGNSDPSFKPPAFLRFFRLFPTDPGEWVPAQLNSLALATDGKLYVVGDFTRVGTTQNQISTVVRLNLNGSLEWGEYGGGASGNDVLALPGGGAVVSAGSLVFGVDANWTFHASDGDINTLALAPDGVYVGGSFTSIGNVPSAHVARLLTGDLPLKVSIYLAPSHDSLVLSLNAPIGSDVLLEKSTDINNWTLVQDFHTFSGPQTVSLKLNTITKLFFRARTK